MTDSTKSLIKELHDGYQARCRYGDRTKQDWRQIVCRLFPPVLAADDQPRASLILAEKTGDMGLALLWIVQAALIAPLLKLNHETAEGGILLGALAHSEDKKNPVIAEKKNDDGAILKGTKKYITAGNQADFILVTARRAADNKISEIYRLGAHEIFPSEMKSLDLGALYTIEHGRLTLKGKKISGAGRLPLDAAALRRHLAVWGIVERGLILEACMAGLLYLARRRPLSKEKHTADILTDLTELLHTQQAGLDKMIQNALAGNYVNWRGADITALRPLAETILAVGRNRPDMDEKMRPRFEDVRLLVSFWK